jgi:serine/threonine protein kinase
MSEYEIVQDHFLFEELGSDSVGTNYRAGKIIDRKTEKHIILSEVHPFLSGSTGIWKGLKVLLEGVKKSKIAHLLCPEDVIEEDQKAFLIYPFLKHGTLEDILNDARQNGVPIDIDLAFSIVIAVADILDQGSGITINKKKSFHGLLTPDNIIIDIDGKVFLKNYGIFPYLKKIPEHSNRLIEKYGSLLPPECLQQEKPTPQTDVYILGNIIYRLMTGEYFTYSPDDDFESKLSTLEFTFDIIPPEEGDFEDNIMTLFKKTLNPDPAQRFADIKEFTEYFSNNFRISEVSSATFVIAYFMNLLYMKTSEAENARLKEELSYEMPEEEVADDMEVNADYLKEEIAARLEEQQGSKSKYLIALLVVIAIAVGTIGFLYINQQKQAKEQQQAQIQRDQELKRRMDKFEEDLKAEYQRRLKAIEDKSALTKEEKQNRDMEIEKLREWRQAQEKKNLEQARKIRAALEKKPIPVPAVTVQKQEIKKPEKKAEPEPKKIEPKETASIETASIETRPKETATIETGTIESGSIETVPGGTAKVNQIDPGSLVPLNTVTYSPNKVRGKSNLKAGDFKFSRAVTKKYKGQQLTLQPQLLVNEVGNVTDVKIHKTLPYEMFSQITTALKKWKFFPAEVNKVKVKVWFPVTITISFGGSGAKGKTEKQVSKDEITPLDAISFRPSRLSGKSRFKVDDFKFSRAIKKKYKGQTLTLRPKILVDKTGKVRNVNFASAIPIEIRAQVKAILLKWKYIPAEKNKVAVNVWLPAKLTISFK